MTVCSFKLICLVAIFIDYFGCATCPRRNKNTDNKLNPGQSLRQYNNPSDGKKRNILTGQC